MLPPSGTRSSRNRDRGNSSGTRLPLWPQAEIPDAHLISAPGSLPWVRTGTRPPTRRSAPCRSRAQRSRHSPTHPGRARAEEGPDGHHPPSRSLAKAADSGGYPYPWVLSRHPSASSPMFSQRPWPGVPGIHTPTPRYHCGRQNQPPTATALQEETVSPEQSGSLAPGLPAGGRRRCLEAGWPVPEAGRQDKRATRAVGSGFPAQGAHTRPAP